MRKTRICFALFLLVAIAVSGIGATQGASAQSIPKPSIPQFRLKYVDFSYNVPPTYGTNDYTGEKIILSSGYDVINRTVQFTIKNQPFNGNIDSNGNPIGLYYHIRYKGSYGDTWSDFSVKEGNSIIFHDTLVFPASNSSTSEVTVGEYSFAGNGLIGDKGPYNINLPTDGKIDFQVQALIGTAQLFNANWVLGDFAVYYYNFTGQTGDWSSTQTIAIGENSAATISPNPTSPNQPLAPSTMPTGVVSTSYSISLLVADAFVFIIVAIVGVITAVVLLFLYLTSRGKAKHV